MQPDKTERGKAMRQVVAAFVANLGTINTGLMFGFSAVVIPQLKAVGSTIPIDETQESWVGKWHFWLILSVKLIPRTDNRSLLGHLVFLYEKSNLTKIKEEELVKFNFLVKNAMCPRSWQLCEVIYRTLENK